MTCFAQVVFKLLRTKVPCIFILGGPETVALHFLLIRKKF